MLDLTMRRYFIGLLLVALISFGCGRSSAPPIAASTQWTTNFGTYHDPVTGWAVSVTKTNGIRLGRPATKVSVGIAKFEATSTVSPSDWKARAGWFTYAESKERVWAYDGDSYLFLLTWTPSGTASYKRHSFPCPVPREVYVRLSAVAQKDIESHD